MERVHRPVLAELARRGAPYVGLLYAGLMLTEDGPRVLEFNCRFGDPETQAVLPRLDGDLLSLLASAAQGRLDASAISASADGAVTVVLAAEDIPKPRRRASRSAGWRRRRRPGRCLSRGDGPS